MIEENEIPCGKAGLDAAVEKEYRVGWNWLCGNMFTEFIPVFKGKYEGNTTF